MSRCSLDDYGTYLILLSQKFSCILFIATWPWGVMIFPLLCVLSVSLCGPPWLCCLSRSLARALSLSLFYLYLFVCVSQWSHVLLILNGSYYDIHSQYRPVFSLQVCVSSHLYVLITACITVVGIGSPCDCVFFHYSLVVISDQICPGVTSVLHFYLVIHMS